MLRVGRELGVALACVCAIGGWTPAYAQAQDIIVVLDNSGSMRRNDPQFLARDAVERLVDTAGADTRVALMLFDTEPRLLVPLSAVTPTTRSEMLASLRQLDYRGQWTNIPSAIERAIYHFRRQPVSAAPRTILFMTDGRVDTGDAARDRDNERWLLDEVTLMARDSGIRIFGIAFTNEADFRVIQTLAERTGGDHLRADTPAELVSAFADLQHLLKQVPEPAVAAPSPPAEPAVASPAPAELPPEVVDTVAVESAAPGAAAWLQQPTALAGLGAGALLLAGSALAFLRRRRSVEPAARPPTAMLTDIGGITGRAQHDLATAVSVIGRQKTPGAAVTSIVIDRATVSRRHATIRWYADQYWIEDHATTNGTFVNDKPVTAARPLRNGDRIRVDSFEFEFSTLEPAADADRTLLAGAEPADDRTVVSVAPPPGRAQPQPAPATAAVAAKPEYEFDLLVGDDDIDAGAEVGDDATVIFTGTQIRQRKNQK